MLPWRMHRCSGIPQPQIFVSERTPEGAELTQMDYEVYPAGTGARPPCKVAEEFKGDLIVTENGIATADDTRRVAFIRQALDGVQHCIADGIPVKGLLPLEPDGQRLSGRRAMPCSSA